MNILKQPFGVYVIGFIWLLIGIGSGMLSYMKHPTFTIVAIVVSLIIGIIILSKRQVDT